MTDMIVAGHICLDILPTMDHVSLKQLVKPGALFEVGQLKLVPGGAVSNVGLTAYRLGIAPILMATLGNDMIGRILQSELQNVAPDLDFCFRSQPDQQSSYSIVLSPQNADRTFLHCAGTNENFDIADISYAKFFDSKIFYLGYPTVLPKLIEHGGQGLLQILEEVKRQGITTAMDMSMPDLNQPGEQNDWRLLLQRVLPHVDIFLPSIEEILIMLRHKDYERWGNSYSRRLSLAYLFDLAQELLDMGAAVVGFKLGEYGMFVRTCNESDRLHKASITSSGWLDETIYRSAFQVEVSGTTGAGDAACAGFLTALIRGQNVSASTEFACGVGAAVVESLSGIRGIDNYDEISRRIDNGWKTHDSAIY